MHVTHTLLVNCKVLFDTPILKCQQLGKNDTVADIHVHGFSQCITLYRSVSVQNNQTYTNACTYGLCIAIL